MEYHPVQRQHLSGIIALCEGEPWPSFVKDPGRTWRALRAPGVTTVVAVDCGQAVGFVQMQGDGEIQAHLSLILVAEDRRREGIATRLVQEAFRLSGAERVDVVTDCAPEFYRSLACKEWHGFRIYPQYNKDGTPNQAFQPPR